MDQPNEASDQFVNTRNTTWLGRSTVCTMSAGHRFQLTDGPLDALAGSANQESQRSTFVTTDTICAGINNLHLPKSRAPRSRPVSATASVNSLRDRVERTVRMKVVANAFDVSGQPAHL